MTGCWRRATRIANVAAGPWRRLRTRPRRPVILSRRSATAASGWALDRFDEPAHRDLIGRLAVSDRAGAIALYERLAERLRRELGVAVSPQTRALADRVRGGQLDHVVAPAETPASVSRARAAAPPLPHALLARRLGTGFVGRADALARLQALWGKVVAGEQR